MLYWLIPYLVAFNTTGSENWPHGPEYLFKANMETFIELTTNISTTTNFIINFSCRPLNESSIRCRVESAEGRDSKIDKNNDNPKKKEIERDFDITNWAFEVQFDRHGLYKIESLNADEDHFHRKIIRAIFEAINVGSDYVSQLRIGSNILANEVSPFGTCDAQVGVETVYKSGSSSEAPGKHVEFYMDVPSFTERSENESLIINKERLLDHCLGRTPYFFSSHGGPDDTVNYNTTMSETGIYFGRHHFVAGIINRGSLTLKLKNGESLGTTDLISGKAGEIIRIELEGIRGATEKL